MKRELRPVHVDRGLHLASERHQVLGGQAKKVVAYSVASVS